MEFIGITGNSSDIDLHKVKEIAEEVGMVIVVDNPEYDIEVAGGLKDFASLMHTDYLIQLILPFKEKHKSTTSSLLTEELHQYYIHGTRSLFIDFIQAVQSRGVRLKKAYIIFASEWENTKEYVRYTKCSIEAIADYFKVNNGWQMLFYSLKSQSYYVEYYSPLIFEVSPPAGASLAGGL